MEQGETRSLPSGETETNSYLPGETDLAPLGSGEADSIPQPSGETEPALKASGKTEFIPRPSGETEPVPKASGETEINPEPSGEAEFISERCWARQNQTPVTRARDEMVPLCVQKFFTFSGYWFHLQGHPGIRSPTVAPEPLGDSSRTTWRVFFMTSSKLLC